MHGVEICAKINAEAALFQQENWPRLAEGQKQSYRQ